jgi:restriction endonuclease Mrr
VVQDAVSRLKKIVTPHQNAEDEKRKIKNRLEREKSKKEHQKAFREKLGELKKRFISLSTDNNEPQKRGYELEKLMNELFRLYDYDPKASFKVSDEQIDGAFSFDGTDYLFEAKWQKKQVESKEFASFSAKINHKLVNTSGVFLAINGFSKNAVSSYSKIGANFFLMDGSDLFMVLDERISFDELLLRKRRHASRTGEIFLTFSEMSKA